MNPVDTSPNDSVSQSIQTVSLTINKKGRKWRSTRFLAPVVLTCLLVAGLALWLTACGQRDSNRLPVGMVSYDFIKSRPEAHLYYPGSTVFSPFGGPEERHLFESNNSAFAGAVLITKDPPEQIYQWYKDWMLSHGWQPHVFPRATTQTSLEGYVRGSRERFFVAMDDPELLSGTLGRKVPQGEGTVFEITFLIVPASK